MSGGRVELGLGAGWYRDEHLAYGIPFPSVAERFDNLEEQLRVITGLWATPEGGRFDAPGPRYPITASPGLPKPVQRPGPPIIVGGGGPRRTPHLAATFASEFNLPFSSLERFAEQCDRVRAACAEIGRDPSTITYSAALVACCGRTAADVTRRAAALGREPAELRANGAAGTMSEVTDTIGRWHEAGAARLYLQVLDLDDLDHLGDLATCFDAV